MLRVQSRHGSRGLNRGNGKALISYSPGGSGGGGGGGGESMGMDGFSGGDAMGEGGRITISGTTFFRNMMAINHYL